MNQSTEMKGVRESVSNQLFAMVNGLAEQIQALSDRVNNRLEPISRPNTPCPTPVQNKAEEWPPYFAKMRSALAVIQSNIYNIESAIDRMEV